MDGISRAAGFDGNDMREKFAHETISRMIKEPEDDRTSSISFHRKSM